MGVGDGRENSPRSLVSRHFVRYKLTDRGSKMFSQQNPAVGLETVKKWVCVSVSREAKETATHLRGLLSNHPNIDSGSYVFRTLLKRNA